MENSDRAIELLENALRIVDKEDNPERWVSLTMNLGLVYKYRMESERNENLKKAIFHLEKAKEALNEINPDINRDFWFENWVYCLNGLASAYDDLNLDDRAENTETAIKYYQEIEQEMGKRLTRENNPKLWATVMTNLGITYQHRIKGDRVKNLRLAIKYFEEGLP